MNYFHPKLAAGGWFKLSFLEQMANVGSEIQRTILWQQKKNTEYSRQAFWRALELVDLTIADIKNKSRLLELTRTRECLVDFFVFDNRYKSSVAVWKKYFYAFTFAARRGS